MNLGNFGDRALLTGAGLSKNWGGYLSGELWGCLLSHPRIAQDGELRKILLRRPNFEVALAEVRKERQDVDAFLAALRDTFETHSRLLTSGEAARPNTRKFLRFVKQFKGDGSGYFFTLNQDLLIEGLQPAR